MAGEPRRRRRTRVPVRHTPEAGRSIVLVHLHVPKCAGSTINGLMRAALGGRAVAMSSDTVAQKVKTLAARAPGPGYSALFGHLQWGFHRDYDLDCVYFSALRDPIDRICSYFNFIQVRPQHHLHGRLREHLRDLNDIGEDVFEAVPPLRTIFGNAFARAYTGRRATTARRAIVHVTRQMRDGRMVLDEPDRIIADLGERLGVAFEPERRNVTDLRVMPEEIVPASAASLSPRATEVLRALNAVDFALLDAIRAFNARR